MDPNPSFVSAKTRQLKENIENLLFKTNICGICLSEAQELDSLDAIYYVESAKRERLLKDIIGITFGHHVPDLLPTKHVCRECVTVILKSYFMLKKIRTNHGILQKHIDTLTQQAMYTYESEKLIDKHLLLTIDNVNRLNVPTAVTVKEKENNITQIFLCDLDDYETVEPEFEFVDIRLKYECPYCGKQFHDEVSFKAHHSLHNEVYFRCFKCSKRYKYFNDFIKHRKIQHSDDLKVCEVCQIILLNHESITEHKCELLDEFLCPICKIRLDSQLNLEKHNIENHSNVECKKCSRTFPNDLKLEHHRCPYKCSECKDECVHEEFLSSYKSQHLAKANIFICPLCEYRYHTKCQIVCHANEEHLNHMPYLCDLCGENFASRPHLTLHTFKTHSEVSGMTNDKAGKYEGTLVSSDTNQMRYNCDSCRISFTFKEAYEKHLRLKHLPMETNCRFCESSFCNIGQLNVHMKRNHPEEITNRNIIYRCTMCPADYISKTEYLQHIVTHPKSTNYVCRECKEIIPSKKKYISHVRKHRIQYDKVCPICFKKYTKHSIARHMRLHNLIKEGKNETILICDICTAKLPNEKALVKHAKNHTETRQCPHCDMSINSVLYSKHLSTHVQTEKQLRSCSECNYTTKFAICLEAHINRHHLKVRPYRCELCNKSFYSEYTLKGHKMTHKEVRPEHYCHICGKKFISKKALTLHTRIHTGEQPYPCELCDLSFLSASRRRQHVVRKHLDPSFECQICNKKMYTQSDLKRHIGDCHDGVSKRKRSKRIENIELESDQE